MTKLHILWTLCALLLTLTIEGYATFQLEVRENKVGIFPIQGHGLPKSYKPLVIVFTAPYLHIFLYIWYVGCYYNKYLSYIYPSQGISFLLYLYVYIYIYSIHILNIYERY